MKTNNHEYAQRLLNLQNKNWKKASILFNPYKYHLAYISKGKTLEVGCGIGRVLSFLPGRSTGIDHNKKAIEICKEKDLNAFTSEDFLLNKESNLKYDTLIFSHVLEHMSFQEADKILKEYLPFLKQNGRLILITPQIKGFNSDPSHVYFMKKNDLIKLAKNNYIEKKATYSFPFPDFFGKYFIYNENVFIGNKK